MLQGKNGANPRRICEYFNTETAKIIRQKTRFGFYSLPYATKTVSLGRAGEGWLYVTDNLLNLEKSVVQLNDINIYPESVNTLIVNK
ncbi:MAG: hypothetical protein J6A60_04040 [Clostridia bacterium]|nr:hypothetical protein [Clostridia bacterium]